MEEVGSLSDLQVRVIQKYWKRYFNEQPLSIDYRTIANGEKGFHDITQAKADGYSIGLVSTAEIVLQGLKEKGYDDWVQLGQVAYYPLVLYVSQSSSNKTVDLFCTEAKKKNGKLTVGLLNTSDGCPLALSSLQQFLGIKVTPLLFASPEELNAALAEGTVEAALTNLLVALRDADKAHLVAIAAEQPVPLVKDVPTFKEQGVDFTAGIRKGLAVPKGTNMEIVKRLRDGIKKICMDIDYLKDMERIGQSPEFLFGEEVSAIDEP
nr:tripartite tricarboxylate transporter substrate-binding protein [Heliobacterium chlorum]